MKTLILNGSPRRQGDTVALLGELKAHLAGDVMTVETYYANIRSCIDCRYCRKRLGCAIPDDMYDIYDYIQECDNIVIASPVYFSELTGTLLALASRLQIYWCARSLRGETPIEKPKRGGILLVGGGDGSPAKAQDTARCLLRMMNANDVAGVVYSLRTDTLPAAGDEAALRAARELAEKLNAGVTIVG